MTKKTLTKKSPPKATMDPELIASNMVAMAGNMDTLYTRMALLESGTTRITSNQVALTKLINEDLSTLRQEFQSLKQTVEEFMLTMRSPQTSEPTITQ